MAEDLDKNGTQYDCDDCTDEDKEIRGCHGGLIWKVGGHDITGCPQKLITLERQEIIEAYLITRDLGIPMFAGGWADWPAIWVDRLHPLSIEDRMIKNDAERRAIEEARGK